MCQMGRRGCLLPVISCQEGAGGRLGIRGHWGILGWGLTCQGHVSQGDLGRAAIPPSPISPRASVDPSQFSLQQCGFGWKMGKERGYVLGLGDTK